MCFLHYKSSAFYKNNFFGEIFVKKMIKSRKIGQEGGKKGQKKFQKWPLTSPSENVKQSLVLSFRYGFKYFREGTKMRLQESLIDVLLALQKWLDSSKNKVTN